MRSSATVLWLFLVYSAVSSTVPRFVPTSASYSQPRQIGVRRGLEGRATATDYETYATSAISYLQTWWNGTSGLYNQQWWNSANVITMLADFQEHFPEAVEDLTSFVFSQTLSRAPSHYGFAGFLNNYYDDELWWALAFIKVYQVTGQGQYLGQAVSIFEDAKSVWGTSACGGLWWDKPHTQVNIVANALYMTTAAKLANILPKTPSEYYYLNEATRSYAWIMASGMLNSENLFNDGLDLTTCKNNNGYVFTYNQGEILSGLVEMTWATGDSSYNELANTIALAAITKLAPDGVLADPCEPNACSGDEQQFKGVFVRNIQFMVNRASVLPAATKTTYVEFLQKNADSIWAVDQQGGRIGLVWSGKYQTATLQTQSSGLDALVAAASVTIGQNGIMSRVV